MHMAAPTDRQPPTSLLGVLTYLSLDTPEFRQSFEAAIADELGIKQVSYEVEEDAEQAALLIRTSQPDLTPNERNLAFIFTRGFIAGYAAGQRHDAAAFDAAWDAAMYADPVVNE